MDKAARYITENPDTLCEIAIIQFTAPAHRIREREEALKLAKPACSVRNSEAFTGEQRWVA